MSKGDLRVTFVPFQRIRPTKPDLPLSAHCNGAGFDVVFGKHTGMTAEKGPDLIVENQQPPTLPQQYGLEARVNLATHRLL